MEYKILGCGCFFHVGKRQLFIGSVSKKKNTWSIEFLIVGVFFFHVGKRRDKIGQLFTSSVIYR